MSPFAGGNIFAELMEAVRVCSLGQITQALYDVGGSTVEICNHPSGGLLRKAQRFQRTKANQRCRERSLAAE